MSSQLLQQQSLADMDVGSVVEELMLSIPGASLANTMQLLLDRNDSHLSSIIRYSLGKQQQNDQAGRQQLLKTSPNVQESVYTQDLESGHEEGLRLLGLLLQSAEAVAENNLESASILLPQLTELSSPYGSPVQRVAAYFAEALNARLITMYLGVSTQFPGTRELVNSSVLAAHQIFNSICPSVQFAHFTANQAIVEAFEGENLVHIIDLDIMQGLQWPALFHILASRAEGPPRIRITGLGTCMNSVEATGRRLSAFAASLGLAFEFIPVAERAGNLSPLMLQLREDEALAVNCIQHSLYDVTGSDVKTLKLLQQLKPKVLTIVEQELHRVGTFLTRFVEALHYYSAVFDTLSACQPEVDNLDRHIVEQRLLSLEIRNILAVGGPTRSREETFQHWSSRLEQAGFRNVAVSHSARAQANLLLKMSCEGFSATDDCGTLKLAWKGLCLLTASAWSYS